MIHLLWGSIAAVLGLCYLVAETASGLHSQNVSYATVVLWLVLPAVCSMAAIVHHRLRILSRIGYGRALLVGLFTVGWSAVFLLVVWIFFTTLVNTDFFQLMQNYAGIKAIDQHHPPARVAAEIQAAQQIFSTPSFYLVSLLVPAFVGTFASVIGAAFGRRS
jgi:hypothetical protein